MQEIALQTFSANLQPQQIENNTMFKTNILWKGSQNNDEEI